MRAPSLATTSRSEESESVERCNISEVSIITLGSCRGRSERNSCWREDSQSEVRDGEDRVTAVDGSTRVDLVVECVMKIWNNN